MTELTVTGTSAPDAGWFSLLKDGRPALIRRMGPEDGAALERFHGSLSPDTVYKRFFSAHPRLRPEEVTRFTTMDGYNRMALVAVIDDELAGVGRFDRIGDSATAEVAFVVADAYQDQGIATLLLEHLATAAGRVGIVRFEADTLWTNREMLGVFHAVGFEEERSFGDGLAHISFPIDATERFWDAVDERDRRAQVVSIRHVVAPTSVAVVGAGRHAGGIGHEIFANLVRAGYRGRLYPVNASGAEVLGRPSYRSLADIGATVDLVVVAVPAPAVIGVVDDAARAGARALVLITAGFAETGPDGAARQAEVVSLAHRRGMRVVGPNCMGVLNAVPEVSMDATFAPTVPAPGHVAFMSQSGAVGIAVLDLLGSRGLGLSSFVSVGNKADVSGNDLLRYWEADEASRVVLLYLESFGNPRKFARIARQVSRRKPIVALKSGRSSGGHRAARSHTAAAASPDTAVDALFHHTGVIRVEGLADMIDVAALLDGQPLPAGRRVAIIGNSGGPGIMAADACAAAGLALPELSESTQAALAGFAAAGAALANPVDLLAAARGPDYERALSAVLADDRVDAAVVIFTATMVTGPDEVRAAVARATAASDKPVVASFLGSGDAPPPAGTVPCYPFPERAVAALARACEYSEWRAAPEGTRVRPAGIDRVEAAAIAESALGRGAGWLEASEAVRLLSAYGVEAIQTVVVGSADEAAAVATSMGGPVALKADGPVHKTELGGVVLGLKGADEVRRAYDDMSGRLGSKMKGAVLQPMAPAGTETIVGLLQDPAFGPLVMFGMGGVATELIGDHTFRVAPLTDVAAADMVRSLRLSPLLTGFRGRAAADTAALEDLLVRVAELGADHPEVAEIDLNPVVVSPAGAVVLDVKVRVERPAPGPGPLERRLR
ncbi:MAG TPA: GNAT family N-acetyltransferase [Acidimicrobiales bacterium]|nr:GNAT family N-acetyltransferase [Acidimicrobiales bacterium]